MLVSWVESERIAVVVQEELRLYYAGGDARLTLQAVNTSVPSISCVEWFPSPRPIDERILALGQTSGARCLSLPFLRCVLTAVQGAWCSRPSRA